ncbi:MAG TPA: hypothetical protein VGK09_03870 [Rhodocyclaceae bacterium]|jgi:hypothetical protein
MEPTVKVELTLAQLETIADALEYTGQVVEEELDKFEAGSEDHDGLSADLDDLSDALKVVADAMEELVGDDEE